MINYTTSFLFTNILNVDSIFISVLLIELLLILILHCYVSIILTQLQEHDFSSKFQSQHFKFDDILASFSVH